MELKIVSEENLKTDDQGNLFFLYVKLDDDSNFQKTDSPYMCSYNDDDFETKINGSKIYLTVIDTKSPLEYAPIPLKISQKLILTDNNEQPHLDCLYGGYPKPTVKWFLNNTEIKEFENLTMGYLLNLQFNYTGDWLCRVSNGIGPVIEHTFQMVVKQGLYFTDIQNSIETRKGEKVEFKCLAIGDSDLKYEWFYNNQAVDTLTINKRWTVTPNVISIENVNIEDMGVFACRVTSGENEIYDENYLSVAAK